MTQSAKESLRSKMWLKSWSTCASRWCGLRVKEEEEERGARYRFVGGGVDGDAHVGSVDVEIAEHGGDGGPHALQAAGEERAAQEGLERLDAPVEGQVVPQLLAVPLRPRELLQTQRREPHRRQHVAIHVVSIAGRQR
jgi:hypothetical protein